MHQLDKRVEVVKSMKEVLAPADILSVHVPLSDKTRGMIGTEEIDSMKNGCILMNYARNGIFNSYAVLNALNSKKAAIYITDFPDTMLKHKCCASMAVKQLQDFLKYGIVSNSVNFPVSEMLPSQGAKIRLTVVTNDVPNMIATISAIIGNAGLNILGFDNKGNGKIGYNLIDLGEYVNSVIELIRQLPGVLRVRVIKF
jgi:D-3-phosphoglycerate dehydrogenase